MQTTRSKKQKHNRIVVLARIKLNSITKLVSQTLIVFEISYEEDKSIINEEKNYRRLKKVLEWWKVENSGNA